MVEHGSTPLLQSVRELADWPAVLVQTMQQNPKMLFRLEQAVGRGVVGHTDFSGRRCSESALNMSFVALSTAGCQVPDTIRWHRSSDIAEHCQQIALEAQHPPDHVFGSLQSRISAEHLRALERMRPEKTATPSQKASAYAKQWQYLESHLHDLHCHTSPCLKPECRARGHACPLVFESERCHSTRELSLLVGGSMCTPWSPFGLHEGLASEHSESMSIFIAHAKSANFDVVTLENAAAFPKDLLPERMGSRFVVLQAAFGPEDLGWPCRRRCLLQTCINLSSHVWVGPASKDVEKDFLRMFCQSTFCLGDVFLGQCPGEEYESRRSLARKRGLHLPEKCTDAMVPAEKILAPGSADSLQKYRELWMALPPDSDMARCCIVDLSQSMERKRMSALVPTLLSSTLLYSLTRERFFVKHDLEASQGFPVPGTAAYERYAGCLAVDEGSMSNLPEQLQRSLLGNGMHLTAMSAWHMYILGNIVRRDRLQPSPSATMRLSFNKGTLAVTRRDSPVESQNFKKQPPKRSTSFQFEDIGMMFKRFASELVRDSESGRLAVHAEPKNVYCLDHKRAWDVLYRQAKEQKQDCGPKWIAWVEVFGGSYVDPESGETVEESGNEELQAQVLCDYCRKFPGGRRGQKHRGSLDLTHYSRKRGARAEKNSVSQNPLLDYELFSVKMAAKRNWTKQKATGRNKMRVALKPIPGASYPADVEKDEHQRDEGGPAHSRLRLEIPAFLLGKDFYENKQSSYQEREIEQRGKERKNVSQEEMDHIAEDLAKGLEAEGQKEWTAALPSSSIFATATGSGGSEDSATAADFFNSRFLQSDRRQKDFEPQGAENKRVAEKQNPEGTNEDSKKRRVDLGSKRNKISADITRDIEVVPACICRLRTLLADGMDQLSGAIEADGDFKVECEMRVAAGWAWCGASFHAGENKYVNLTADVDHQAFLKEQLLKMAFPIVSDNDMWAQSNFTAKLSEVKLAKTVEDLDEKAKLLETQKELTSELIASVRVAVTDLKKTRTRREKEAKKQEEKDKQKQAAEQKQNESQAAEEQRRSVQLSMMAIPFRLDADLFEPVNMFEKLDAWLASNEKWEKPHILEAEDILDQAKANETLSGTFQKWLATYTNQEISIKERAVAAPMSSAMGNDMMLKMFMEPVDKCSIHMVRQKDLADGSRSRALLGAVSLLCGRNKSISYIP
ncbi:unnamed protein product [Symbiodinium microadriaticum]|nr:unnamed protein product [Symbiodinium microadriaticum]